MTEQDSILSVANVSLTYKGLENHVILSDISFDVKKGKTLGITGESGSGKSMTALCMMNLMNYQPEFEQTGKIIFDGLDVSNASETAWCKLRGNRMAIIFQQPESALNPILRIGHQLKEAVKIHHSIPKDILENKIKNALDEVGLLETSRVLRSYPHQLSGGQLQRVMIAMALINEPDLIIADEVTSSLDVELASGIIDLLLKYQKKSGCALVFITHDLVLLRQISDEILVLKDGKVMDYYPVATSSLHQLTPYTQSYISTTLGTSQVGHLAESGQTLLEVKDISKSYSTYLLYPFFKSSSTSVLSGISFDVAKNQIFGIMGASGSGKSTLAKILVQILEPDSGQILLNQKALPIERCQRTIQMIFQDSTNSLNPRHTVETTLTEMALIKYPDLSKQERGALLEDIMTKVSLPLPLLSRLPHQLSGGQKQRVNLARALLSRADVIIFDEALSALDIHNQKSILDLILQWAADGKLTAIFISHDPKLIQYVCGENYLTM